MFNFFYLPHLGLRNTLLEVHQQVWDIAKGKAPKPILELDNLFSLLSHHAQMEDQFIHPLIAENPLAQINEEDHHELEGIQQQLARDQGEINLDFALRFSAFFGKHLQHMSQEEMEITPLLNKHYNQDELMRVHKNMLDSFSASEHLQWFQCICPALPYSERQDFLNQLEVRLSKENKTFAKNFLLNLES